MPEDLNHLRRQLRQKRRHLSNFQQRQAEQKILHQLRHQPCFQHGQHIGVYLHAFGEIYTHQLILECFKRGKQVYLPKICPMNQHLIWIRISQQQYLNSRFALHHLGMKEPMQHRGKHVRNLDLLIMPLLACDAYGTRLGMGGGFYDRTLSQAPKSPFRLGLAHDFQFTQSALNKKKWDQPLDALITPQKIYTFKHRLL